MMTASDILKDEDAGIRRMLPELMASSRNNGNNREILDFVGGTNEQ
jgi:hypothetical protein